MTNQSVFFGARLPGIGGMRRIFAGLGSTMAVMVVLPAFSAEPAPVNLGLASRFAVLAASEITSVPTSAIKGDVGISPAARSSITGLTPVEVTGTIFAADDGGAVAAMLSQAKIDLTAAYNDAAGRTANAIDVANADLGGRTLTPGLYKSTGTLTITGNLTLDAQGNPDAVFIFQVASLLHAANSSQIILSGNASAANIYWQAGTSATIGTGAIFQGIILAHDSISLATGSTLLGRALADLGGVTLESNAITLIPSRPGLGTIQRLSANSVTLVITNTPGLALTLQSSTNLTVWTTLTTFNPPSSPYVFTNTMPVGIASRFYRAFYP